MLTVDGKHVMDCEKYDSCLSIFNNRATRRDARSAWWKEAQSDGNRPCFLKFLGGKTSFNFAVLCVKLNDDVDVMLGRDVQLPLNLAFGSSISLQDPWYNLDGASDVPE